jgi:hypothetical protein
MIGYQFQITSRTGQSVTINDFTTDPSNLIALQDYPVFDVDIKNSEMDKEGQHGIWDFASFYGKRVLTFSGLIIGQDEAHVETLKRQLLQVTALPAQPDTANDGLVLVKWTDANGDAWQIYAKLERAIRFDRQIKQKQRLAFVMSLKCPDPLIESQTEQTHSGTRGWQTGSLKLASKLPAKFNLIYKNPITITNNGNAQAHTIIRLYGEAGGITNPAIKNVTTGKTFQVNTTLADDTKYVEINSKTGIVKDQAGTDVSGLVDGASEYILLQVGSNELVYLSSESSGAQSPVNTWTFPAAAFSINHRDAIV